jgi:uncharacterized protein
MGMAKRAYANGGKSPEQTPCSPMLTVEKIKTLLQLEPLPNEGGFYAQTYRSAHTLAQGSLPSGYPGDRALATAIYFLLTPESFSAMHRLRGDETYHFYLGDPVEMLQLKPDGSGEPILIGPKIESGMRLQHTIPAGCWQGSRLAPGGKFALLGTTMAPGFDPADFELGDRDQLSKAYPPYAALIALLCR